MPKNSVEPWYAEKRAMAYVSALFAMKSSRILTGIDSVKDYRVDLLVETGDGPKSFMPRQLGIEVKGYLELPSTSELNRRIAKDPVQRVIDTLKIPLLVCVVQFVKLEAVYCWLVEPIVEDDQATLQIPGEYEWNTLDEKATAGILKRVDQFYEALYDITVKKNKP